LNGAAFWLVEWAAAELLSIVVAKFAWRAIGRATKRGNVPHSSRAATRGEPIARLQRVSNTTVLSATPGRLRVAVRGLRGEADVGLALEECLVRLQGVRSAIASPRSGNVLVEFDPTVVTDTRIRAAIESSAAATPLTAAFRIL
jgi:hypothetical protein